MTGRLVADAVPGGAARYVESFGDAPRIAASVAAPGDLVLTMGAGDVTRLGPLILDELAAESRGAETGAADSGAAVSKAAASGTARP